VTKWFDYYNVIKRISEKVYEAYLVEREFLSPGQMIIVE